MDLKNSKSEFQTHMHERNNVLAALDASRVQLAQAMMVCFVCEMYDFVYSSFVIYIYIYICVCVCVCECVCMCVCVFLCFFDVD